MCTNARRDVDSIEPTGNNFTALLSLNRRKLPNGQVVAERRFSRTLHTLRPYNSDVNRRIHSILVHKVVLMARRICKSILVHNNSLNTTRRQRASPVDHNFNLQPTNNNIVVKGNRTLRSRYLKLFNRHNQHFHTVQRNNVTISIPPSNKQFRERRVSDRAFRHGLVSTFPHGTRANHRLLSATGPERSTLD